MKPDSDEKKIKNAINTIQTPNYDIYNEVTNRINTRKYKLDFKKGILMTTIAFFCIITISVAAATIPSFNKLLYIVSPEIAGLLQDVSSSSENNGIRMEVVAAMNDNEMAVIYVTMQDLIDNRIDETLDIYDFSLTGGKMFNSQIVHFDEETGVATLRIQVNGGKSLNGKILGFNVDSFLSQKQRFEGVQTEIDLLDIKNADRTETIPLDMNNIPGGSGDLYMDLKLNGEIDILKADQMNLTIPGIDFMYISNMGFINGRLHIQTKWTGNGVDDHGYLYLVDAFGERIDTRGANISFDVDMSGNTSYGNVFEEYIYDISNIDLDEVSLLGYLVKNNNFTTGSWRTTFRMESVVEERQQDCMINFNDWIATKISVSPIGITIEGKDIGEDHSFNGTSIYINMADGEVYNFNSVISYQEEDVSKLKYSSPLPLDVSKVESVNINGTIVSFNN